MTWRGQERRVASERRLVERRRTMSYNVHTLLIIEGITWVDPDDAKRRRQVRRLADREALAIMFVRHAHP
jgi:hypothetical protein